MERMGLSGVMCFGPLNMLDPLEERYKCSRTTQPRFLNYAHRMKELLILAALGENLLHVCKSPYVS